jgi:hypothetical protein
MTGTAGTILVFLLAAIGGAGCSVFKSNSSPSVVPAGSAGGAISPPDRAAMPDTRAAPVPEPARTVGSLPMIASVRQRPDGSVELSMSIRDYNRAFFLYTRTSAGSSEPSRVALVQPGQHVGIGTYNLGAGYHALQFLGERGEYLLFREHHWFYDIVPETNELVQVRPYGGDGTAQQ